MTYTDPFRAIADPNRRRVLDLLADQPRSVGELAELIGVSQPAMSQQLGVLSKAGLVGSEKIGRSTHYSIEAMRLSEVAGWLGKYETLWDTHLSKLGYHLKKSRN